MTLAFISLQAVRSISQRSLLLYWARLSGRRTFPPLEDFKPEPRIHDPQQLVFWNVENGEHGRFFRALAHGRYFTEAFNLNWAGKTMDEVTPEPLRELILQTARACVDSGCPMYSIFTTFDAGGQQIDCERLLLPFGRYGQVTQFVGSLQLVSVKGSLTRQSALGAFGKAAEMSLAGLVRIDAPKHAVLATEGMKLD